MDEKVLRKFKTNNITTMENIFHNCTQLREMKVKGYFKDVDANATIHDILWNCGVIKDGNCL